MDVGHFLGKYFKGVYSIDWVDMLMKIAIRDCNNGCLATFTFIIIQYICYKKSPNTFFYDKRTPYKHMNYKN